MHASRRGWLCVYGEYVPLGNTMSLLLPRPNPMAESPSLLKKLLRPALVNDVKTGESKWYPELQPRRYRASAEDVFSAARRVINERENWRVTSAHPDEGRIEAEIETKVVGFIDDLTVTVEGEEAAGNGEAGETVVNVHSRSRVGQGDMGQNARTIREFFERLDGQVG